MRVALQLIRHALALTALVDHECLRPEHPHRHLIDRDPVRRPQPLLQAHRLLHRKLLADEGALYGLLLSRQSASEGARAKPVVLLSPQQPLALVPDRVHNGRCPTLNVAAVFHVLEVGRHRREKLAHRLLYLCRLDDAPLLDRHVHDLEYGDHARHPPCQLTPAPRQPQLDDGTSHVARAHVGPSQGIALRLNPCIELLRAHAPRHLCTSV